VLITCVAEMSDGRTIAGRDNLELTNHAWEVFNMRGAVALQFDQPRFPQADQNGAVSWPVTVWHHYNTPVKVTEIRRLRMNRATDAGGRDQHPQEDVVAAVSLLGTDQIPPSGVSFTARFDTRAEPDIAYITYRLIGQTEDRHPAVGEFSIMRPPDAPTPTKFDQRIQDPQMIAKIMAAQRILNRPVTDEDIWRLEREGKLEGAAVDPAHLPQRWVNTPPPDRDPTGR